MKDRSKEEILLKVKELWPDLDYTDQGRFDETPAVVVTKREDAVNIKLQQMYDAPGLSFAQLSALSEFFDTKHIDDADRYGYGGCETCDYG